MDEVGSDARLREIASRFSELEHVETVALAGSAAVGTSDSQIFRWLLNARHHSCALPDTQPTRCSSLTGSASASGPAILFFGDLIERTGDFDAAILEGDIETAIGGYTALATPPHVPSLAYFSP